MAVEVLEGAEVREVAGGSGAPRAVRMERAAVPVVEETEVVRVRGLTGLKKSLEVLAAEEADVKADVSSHVRNDAHLLRFLRSHNFDVDASRASLIKYTQFNRKLYRLTAEDGQMQPMSAADAHPCLAAQPLVPLPPHATDRAGRVVLVSQDLASMVTQAKEHGSYHAFQAIFMCFDRALMDPAAQTHGFSMVADLKGFGLESLRTYSRSRDMQALGRMEAEVFDSLPSRLGHLFLLNPPWYFSAAWQLGKPFISSDLKRKIHLVDSNSGKGKRLLQEVFHMDMLPPHFGGRLEYDFNEQWLKPLLEAERRQDGD